MVRASEDNSIILAQFYFLKLTSTPPSPSWPLKRARNEETCLDVKQTWDRRSVRIKWKVSEVDTRFAFSASIELIDQNRFAIDEQQLNEVIKVFFISRAKSSSVSLMFSAGRVSFKIECESETWFVFNLLKISYKHNKKFNFLFCCNVFKNWKLWPQKLIIARKTEMKFFNDLIVTSVDSFIRWFEARGKALIGTISSSLWKRFNFKSLN